MKSMPKERNSSNARTNSLTLRANRSNHQTPRLAPFRNRLILFADGILMTDIAHNRHSFGPIAFTRITRRGELDQYAEIRVTSFGIAAIVTITVMALVCGG